MNNETHRGHRSRPDSKTTGNNPTRTTLSACLIVKDEEISLPRCLKSIRDLADEIILVDTGSSDRTISIAEEYNCRIFRFPWIGDFSAARNESLDHASGDWIFVIDADEEVPRSEIVKMRRLIESSENEIVAVSVYNQAADTHKVSSFLPSVRFFRRRLGLRYQGIVHNRLVLAPNVPVLRGDVRLNHYGYDLSREQLEAKRRRTMILLEKQLAQNPDDAFAHFNMAQLLRGIEGLSDEDTCRRIANHAVAVIDNRTDDSSGYRGYRLMAHIQAASALSALGRYEEAETYCRAALAEKPDYLDAVMTLAHNFLAAGKPASAGEYYRRYLELLETYQPDLETIDLILHFPDAPHVAWYGLAIAAELENDLDLALQCYRKVLGGGVEYLDTYCRMADLLVKKGEPGRAEEIFEREIARNDKSTPALYGLAGALEAQGRADRAVAHLEKAIELEPDNARYYFDLGRIMIDLGQIADGIETIKKSFPIAADNPELLFTAGNRLYAAGARDEALAFYSRTLELRPENIDALNNLGNCYYGLGKYEDARLAYERLILMAPEYWPGHRNLGLAYFRLGQSESALEALTRYAEHFPGDADVFRVVGDLLSSLQRFEKAVTSYEQYLRLRPQDTTALLNLAEAYYHLGHREAARLGYRQVLKADPNCDLARKRLASLAPPVAVG